MSRPGKNNDLYCFSPYKNRLSSTLEVKHPQISQQFHSYESTGFNNDQQKTARISPTPYQIQSAQTSAKNKQEQLEDGNNLQAHLVELTHQINTQRDTITRISHIIDYLTEKNQELNYKYVEAVHELARVENFYSEKLQAANNLIKQLEEKCYKCQTPGLSRSTHGKITPMKICSKNPDDNYRVSFNEVERSGLQELGRLILSQKICDVEYQLNNLQQFANAESLQIQTALEHHKYMQAFIEDEVLCLQGGSSVEGPSNKTKQPTVSIQQLLTQYKSQIMGWQNYSNVLKKLLADCISFIQKLFTPKDLKVETKKRSYTSSDLVKYISQQICNNFSKNLRKNKQQTQQMRQLLKDAFAQLKKYEQKQKDPIQIQQS